MGRGREWFKFEIVSSSKEFYHLLLCKIVGFGSDVCLIDCGCGFNPYFLALFAKKMRISEVEDFLKKVSVIRVFTVHQLKAALFKAEGFDFVVAVDIQNIFADADISLKRRKIAYEFFMREVMRADFPMFLINDDKLFTNYDKESLWEKFYPLPLKFYLKSKKVGVSLEKF